MPVENLGAEQQQQDEGGQCRTRGADPSNFGLAHVQLKGLWFIAGNVLRDLASLNRMEMLPWDVWGAMDMNDDALTGEKKALIDRVAALTLAGDEAFGDVRAIYESNERLRVPPVVFNALRNAPDEVAPLGQLGRQRHDDGVRRRRLTGPRLVPIPTGRDPTLGPDHLRRGLGAKLLD